MEERDCQWNLACTFLYLQQLATSHNALGEECTATGIRIHMVTKIMGAKFIRTQYLSIQAVQFQNQRSLYLFL